MQTGGPELLQRHADRMSIPPVVGLQNVSRFMFVSVLAECPNTWALDNLLVIRILTCLSGFARVGDRVVRPDDADIENSVIPQRKAGR